MSYCRKFPCSACAKQDKCTDYKDIEEAICKIHQKTYENGHQGSGAIVIECSRIEVFK